MTDIKNPKLLWAKGFLFLVLGLMTAGLILLETPSVKIALLLCVSIWAFCRAYYFAFYVIQHYVDPTYRFSGLVSFLRYRLEKRRKESAD